MRIPFYKFEALSVSPLLEHGTAFRYYLDDSGCSHSLCLGRREQGEVRGDHMDAFCHSLDMGKDALYLPRQVHGNRVVVAQPSLKKNEEADAVITCIPQIAIGVLTADCLPILLFDPETPAIGVVHAGRLGTSLKIVSRTVARMQTEFGSRPQSVVMALGPAIGGCCYEVEEDCIEPFREQFSGWKDFVRPVGNGKAFLDLVEANIQDAVDIGLDPGKIFRSGECTACHVDRWYSYRKEGITGRMVTAMMLR